MTTVAVKAAKGAKATKATRIEVTVACATGVWPVCR